MSTDAHPFPLYPKTFSGLPLRDITTAEDLRRAREHEHLAATLAPDVATSAGVHARDDAAENVLREVHVDETLPAGSWHAGPPRPRTASADPVVEVVQPVPLWVADYKPPPPALLAEGVPVPETPPDDTQCVTERAVRFGNRVLTFVERVPAPRDVRDIREAMHPASNPLDDLPPFKPPTRMFGGDVAGSSCRLTEPHIATLPDGARVNLPAGTVLREGEIERRSLPPINLTDALVRLAHGECDSAEKAALMHFIRCWHQPSREVIARDLLQRARVLLVETGGADVLAEVDAFLAGAPPK